MSTPLKLDESWGAVFYADGGANPNPGPTGFGFHGYFYKTTEVPSAKPEIIANPFSEFSNPESRDNNVVDYSIMTDHGYIPCKTNGEFMVKSDAKQIKPDHYVDVSFAFDGINTNNIGEMSAALRVFQLVLEVGPSLKSLRMALDSQYVLNTLKEYMHGWKANNWLKRDGNPPANLDLVKMLYAKNQEVLAQGTKIEYCWIKGHSGNQGNGMADNLATVGVRRSAAYDPQESLFWSPGKNYWKPDVERHPFLFSKRAYFNRVTSLNVPGQYYLIEPASLDLMIGKRDHEGYAVVRLKEPCKYMESVMEAQSRFGQDINHVMLVRMERLYNKFVQKYLRWFGSRALAASRNLKDVVFFDQTPVAVEHNPPALIYRATEAFASLDARLNEFLEKTGQGDGQDEETEPLGIIIHDITDHFYSVGEKKVGKEVVQAYTLHPQFVVGYTNHTFEVTEDLNGQPVKLKIAMALGLDLPNRNQLKQMEALNPKVYLITWRDSDNTAQYAFVVDSLSGTGIWSNYFCDRIFLQPTKI